ncbi:VQ motif [Musa troglodytarum]|nr:VQ motif [Musa troglodytarum]
MDPSESRPSPRRQLQGPRPTPLKVSKDSYKIKKPPVAPPPRAPIVIYAVSPTIIHAQPGEFMTLVQRLTGPSSSADVALPSPTGELSPAALIAAFERATPTHAGNRRRGPAGDRGVADAGPARFVPGDPVAFAVGAAADISEAVLAIVRPERVQHLAGTEPSFRRRQQQQWWKSLSNKS